MIELPTIDDCDDCNGACCRDATLPGGWYYRCVYPDLAGNDGDQQALDALPDHLWHEVETVVQLIKDERLSLNGRCIWLTADGRCREYEHRPKNCRRFEVGSRWCRLMRREHGVDKGATECQ